MEPFVSQDHNARSHTPAHSPSTEPPCSPIALLSSANNFACSSIPKKSIMSIRPFPAAAFGLSSWTDTYGRIPPREPSSNQTEILKNH